LFCCNIQSKLHLNKKGVSMRKNFFSGILTGIIISILIISCGSAPPAVETPAPEPAPAQPAVAPPPPPPAAPRDPDSEPPDQAAIDSLYNAVSRVETSRKQAQDIDGPRYFPPEWEAAEGQYASAKEDAKDATLGDVKKAITLYDAVAETYDNLARACLPLFYTELEAEILHARDEAIDAGITELSPDRLEAADQYIDRALERYEAGEPAENYYAAAEDAFNALDRYRALRLYAGAYRIGEEILERGFARYDPDNYEAAEESINRASAAYDSGDAEIAAANAEEAYLRYNLVLSEGWAASVGEKKTAAENERRRALEAKANVAVKKEFSDADALFSRGSAAFTGSDLAGASVYYAQSIPLFTEAIKAAEAKRELAEEAIRIAESRITQSDETAREAELVLQGDAE
jgi:hypothetical protein